MPRFIALLRAINVGGHNVKMDRLRRLFEELGYLEVETFIASGNVTFETEVVDAATLEIQIERHLHQSLGYEVATFIRSPAELVAVAARSPFPTSAPDAAGIGLYIGFLKAPPSGDAQKKVMALGSEVDDFHVHGRELYWLSRGNISRSAISGGLLEKTLRMPLTMRNSTTVTKLAAKYPPLD